MRPATIYQMSHLCNLESITQLTSKENNGLALKYT